jgi:hypothetical protein
MARAAWTVRGSRFAPLIGFLRFSLNPFALILLVVRAISIVPDDPAGRSITETINHHHHAGVGRVPTGQEKVSGNPLLAQAVKTPVHIAATACFDARMMGNRPYPVARLHTVSCLSLQVDSNRKSDTWILAVVKVVPAVIIDVKIIGVVPVCCPIFRPGVHEQERKAAVRETRIPLVNNGAGHPEPVLTSEIEAEAGLRNVVTAIASTLCPGAMIAVPVLSTILLKCAMPLPSALLLPSPLLLPRDCLLLRTLR